MRFNRSLFGLAIVSLGTIATVVSLRADGTGPDRFEIRPRGHGTVIRDKPHNGPTGGTIVTGNGINYNGGPVMTSSPVNLYYILYGNWASQDPTGPAIFDNWANHIGGSPYFNINTTYADTTGNVPNAVAFQGTYTDTGTLGTALNDASIGTLTSNAINHGFPGAPVPAGTPDPNGLYMVLTAPGVAETTGFLNRYCGWHWSGSFINGSITEGSIASGYPVVKFAFIGNAAGPSFGSCAIQSTSPNGDPGADAMISVMAHELSETVTDPEGNAWYATNGEENGDLCAWNFGATYAANGSLANVNLAGTNYLMQQIWLNANGGGCALSYAATPDFSVGISNSPQSVAQGNASSNYTATATDMNGFSGTVTWTFGNAPAGITVTPTSSLTGNSATFTLTAAANLAAGSYPVTVTGASGALVHSTTASLTVTAPDFNVSVSGAQTVPLGGTSNSYTLTATPMNGFNGTVSWTFGALPSGIMASPNPPASGNSSSAKLTAMSASPGTYSIPITASSGSLQHSMNATLVVSAGSFNLSMTPSSQTASRPSSGASNATYTYSVNVTSVGGFTNPVTLSVTGGTTGVMPAITGTNPVVPGSSGIVTVTVTSSAKRNRTRTLTVTGSASGTSSKTATATITVQ